MLAIKNLRHPLDHFQIDINVLTVETGSIFLLLGPTGSGKSKLLEILAGFESAEAGQVHVGTRNVTELPPEKRGIAIIFQEPQLFPHLSVAGNIGYASQNKALFRRIVGLLGLTPHLSKPVSVISGGERQLVAIARALMIKPEILLLDEAFSAIDPDQRRRVLRSFLAVQKEFQITTLAVTHNFDEALYLGSQVGILMKGNLTQVGEPQEVFQHPSDPTVARFLGAENLFYGQFERSDPSPPDEPGEVPLLSATFRSENGVTLSVLAENEGPGYVLVHPRDITLSGEKPKASSALNQLEGVIRRIVDKGVLVQVHIDAGMPFEVSITPQSRKGLGLEEGSHVYLSFKATAVKTY